MVIIISFSNYIFISSIDLYHIVTEIESYVSFHTDYQYTYFKKIILWSVLKVFYK